MVFTVGSLVTKLEDINHIYLKSRIISLCGGDTWSEIILLEKFRVKIVRRVAHLIFSLQTIKRYLIPSFKLFYYHHSRMP